MLKRRLTIFAAIAALIGIFVYACIPIYVTEPFFSLSLSNPEAPINELFKVHYPLRSHLVRTPIALDAKGRIYIVGRKGNQVRIVVLSQSGNIERVIVPRFKNGRFLRECVIFAVSPSGKRIWTIKLDETISIKKLVHRVTVHDRNGRGEMDWLVRGYPTVYWVLNAYSEESAYAMVANGHLTCFRFVIGQKQPQKFNVPGNLEGILFPILFHDGKYWGIKKLSVLARWIGERQLKTWGMELNDTRGWVGVVAWTPQEGARLVAKLRRTVGIGAVKWIDEQGNFYALRNFPLNAHFLLQILERIARQLGIPDLWKPHMQSLPILRRFSPKGEIMDSIVLPAVIRPAKGEKLEYGQLVKVDETGIYLEVERVSEPKEYRIVKIVKKRRWQVWLERLVR